MFEGTLEVQEDGSMIIRVPVLRDQERRRDELFYGRDPTIPLKVQVDIRALLFSFSFPA